MRLLGKSDPEQNASNIITVRRKASASRASFDPAVEDEDSWSGRGRGAVVNPQARCVGQSVVDAAAEDAHSRLRYALAWCRRPAHLRRTVRLALLVGLILTAVNQLQVIVEGDATVGTWVRCAANFVIPFIVANLGLLSARGASPSEGGACGRGARDGYDRRG